MASPTPKRRLPVLNSPSAEADEAESRRPWQWVGFGTLAIITAWVPLAALAGVAVAHLPAPDGSAPDGDRIRLGAAAALGGLVALVGLYGMALALGSALGGFLIGRWGPTGVGVREAAFAGLGAGVVAAAIGWLSSGVGSGVGSGASSAASWGPSAGGLLVVAVAVPMAALGGRAGARARTRRLTAGLDRAA
jgi:hypothetical protein